MRLPPLSGAVQLTVAEPLPAVAVTPVGAPGAVGGVAEAGFRSRAVIAQGVLGPVPTVAFAVAPLLSSCSSASVSTVLSGETLDRSVHPDPAVRVWLKPESA
jgi:Mn2+/Fe2+ NRAMP family transporter